MDSRPCVLGKNVVLSSRVAVRRLERCIRITGESQRMQRTVLMIANPFPPYQSVGVLRVTKFAKHLARLGWNVAVLTPYLSLPGPPSEVEVLAGSPVTVTRTRFLGPQPFYDIARRLVPKKPPIGQGSDRSVTERGGAPGLQSLPRARRDRINAWMFVPDEFIGWVPFAVRRGSLISRQHGVQLVFSSSPFASNHLAAAIIGRRLHIPWVADFRDPWVEVVSREYPTTLHRWLDGWLEQWVLRHASCVTTVTEPLRDLLAAKRNASGDRGVRLIRNGYDPEDFAALSPHRDYRMDGRVRIVHTGTFYGLRNPEGLIRALIRLRGSQPDLFEKIDVWLVGKKMPTVLSMASQASLEGVMHFIEHVPHRESLQHMLDADILLIVSVPDRFSATLKVYEYLAAGRPILALAQPGGALAMLLEQTGGSIVVPLDDDQAIAAGLERMVRLVLHGKLPRPSRKIVSQYEWGNLSRQLAAVFEELLQEPYS